MRKLLLALMVTMGFVLTASAQKTISGKVTDANGNPIPNVSVIVKGKNIGTATAADGTFTLNVPADGQQIEFSILGFETQTVSVNARSFSPVLVSSAAKELGEVVVTGIQRVKKSQYTGAASKIDEKELRNQPVGSFDQIFQGRVPGVTALTGSGAPGTSALVIIRGQGSIQGGVEPLYVVDGIPVEPSVFQGLDPNTFASVDVLRDASSTALYGSRGSAGVIVITTKKGSTGKMRFGYSAQMGVRSKPEFTFRPMSTSELLDAQRRYGKVSGDNDNQNIPGWYLSPENPRYQGLTAEQKAQADNDLDSISRINTNWQDEIFRRGNFSNHQISLSGGSGNTALYSSLSLYNEEGITLRSDMSRVTLMNNIDFNSDKFKFSVTNNLSYTKRNFQQSTAPDNLGNPFLVSAVNVPYAKVYNEDGSYATGLGTSNGAANTLDITKYDENYNNQFKGTLGITSSYRIIPSLTAAITAGVDFRETQATNYGSKLAFIRKSSSSILGQAGFQRETLTRYLGTTVRPSLTFRQLFAADHDIEVMVLGEYLKEFNKGISGTGYGIDPRTPNTLAAVTPGNAANQLFQSVTGNKSENSLVSGLLTARYTYKGKYTLSGSFRSDGSSKLPPNTRWQQFYSIGGVWDITKEDFIADVRPINSMRLKVSYGSSGNANNFPGGDYPYQATYTNGTYGGLTTIIATYPGNPDMRWEKTYVTNVGLDFEIINRRIYGDVNFYNKVTKDLFVFKDLSATSGFGGLNINDGELQNKGVELSLNADVIRRGSFVWTVNGNFGYNKNRVKSLGSAVPYESGTELIKEGVALGTHYEVRWAGVDAATGQPLYYTKDGQLTNVKSDDDRVQDFGTWEAPWKGGFGTNLRYKGFDLNVLFSFQSGSVKADNMQFFLENPVGFLAQGYNQSADLDFWEKPGDMASVASPVYGTEFSSRILHDASFMRLRNLTLGYTVPKNVVSKAKILSGARFYVQGMNLFIWTKWRGVDPEAGAVNLNLSEYPNPRSITAGLELNF